MKRKILFVLFILFSTNIFATGLRFINYSKIKNLKSYEDEFMFAKNNELLFRSWIHDDYWKANISKEECRNNLNKLYKSICSKAEPKNIEYLLLKGIISEYLYNLDEPGFFDVVEKNYLAIKKIKNADWRYKWFLGFFYHNASAPVKAINELNDVLEKIPEEHLQLVPAFFYDYACVAYVCQMPATALKYLEKFEQYANVDISDDPCFKAAKNILKPFDKSQINKDSLVMKQHKGNLGVFCRPFGFFMNSKSDWIPTRAVISNTQTDFLATFKSQYISTKNGSTSYSVLFWAVLNEENSDTKIFDSFSDDFFNNPNCKQITLLKNRPEIKAYEIFDKEKYSQFGGGHAILVHFTKEYSEDADVKMESAEDFSAHPSIKNGVNFIRYKASMCRANVPVTYFIMLDTCTFIYEESKKDFVNFIEACEFY